MVLTIALTATGWTLYCCLNLHFRRLLKLSSFSMIEDSIVRTKHRSKNAWSWPKLASMFLPWTIGVSHLSAMQPIQISWTFLSVLLLPYNQYYHNQNTLILWIIYAFCSVGGGCWINHHTPFLIYWMKWTLVPVPAKCTTQSREHYMKWCIKLRGDCLGVYNSSYVLICRFHATSTWRWIDLFVYRTGFGDSDGQPMGEEGLIDDVFSLLSFVSQSNPQAKFVLYGHGLGGG